MAPLIPQAIAISPSGANLALSQPVRESALWSIAIDRGGKAVAEPKRLVRDGSERNLTPTFSQDGSKIAWASRLVGGEFVIQVANADGSGSFPLTLPGRDSLFPTWIGDDFTIGYIAVQDGRPDFWLTPLKGAPRRGNVDLAKLPGCRISELPIKAHCSPARRAPTFVREGLVVIDVATGAARNLTPRGRNIGFPAWSPDDRWIAAEERFGGRDSAVVVDVATGAVRLLVDVPGRSWPHDWAPDNDRVVFAGERAGIWNIFWISRTTGKIQQMTHFDSPSEYVRYPAWSPRNDQLVFEHSIQGTNIFAAEFTR